MDAVEDAVDDAMGYIEDQDFAGAEADPVDSVAFYECIAERCKEAADCIRREHGIQR